MSARRVFRVYGQPLAQRWFGTNSNEQGPESLLTLPELPRLLAWRRLFAQTEASVVLKHAHGSALLEVWASWDLEQQMTQAGLDWNDPALVDFVQDQLAANSNPDSSGPADDLRFFALLPDAPAAAGNEARRQLRAATLPLDCSCDVQGHLTARMCYGALKVDFYNFEHLLFLSPRSPFDPALCGKVPDRVLLLRALRKADDADGHLFDFPKEDAAISVRKPVLLIIGVLDQDEMATLCAAARAILELVTAQACEDSLLYLEKQHVLDTNMAADGTKRSLVEFQPDFAKHPHLRAVVASSLSMTPLPETFLECLPDLHSLFCFRARDLSIDALHCLLRHKPIKFLMILGAKGVDSLVDKALDDKNSLRELFVAKAVWIPVMSLFEPAPWKERVNPDELRTILRRHLQAAGIHAAATMLLCSK